MLGSLWIGLQKGVSAQGEALDRMHFNSNQLFGFLWIFWVVFPEEMPDQPQKPGKCKKIKTEKLRTAKKLKSHQMPPETRVETHFMPYASPPSAEAGICLLWLLAAVWFSTGSRGSQRPHPKETV